MFNPSAYAADSLEREALAAHDGKHRLIEEIAPIAHALEGLLEIMNAGRSEAETPRFRARLRAAGRTPPASPGSSRQPAAG